MRKAIDFMKTHPLFTGAFAVVMDFTAIKVLNPDARPFAMALLRLVLIFAVSMCICLISGTKSFEKCHTTTGYILKWNILIMALNIFFLLFMMFSIITGKTPLVDEWPLRLLGAICLFLAVGFVEELTFRVAINDAILYRFRDTRTKSRWFRIILFLIRI